MKVRASIVELFKRTVKVVKGKGENIYWNGDDNLYPNEIERVINNSPTAFRCARLMAKYIGGAGVSDGAGGIKPYLELPVVNPKKHYRITDIISLASRSIAYQYGVFFHVGYGIDENGKIKPVTLDVLDYAKCRISQEDTEENKGKIYFKDYEKKTVFSTQNGEEWFYPFNPNEDVVMAQINRDSNKKPDLAEAIKQYRGQVLYLSLNPEFIYAQSPVDSVFNDADTEFRISIYNNKQTRSGFLGKTAVLTQGLDEEKVEDVKKDLANFLGAEDSDNIYHMDVSNVDDLDSVLKFIQLKPQFDDKLFTETKKTIRENIMGAFNNVPEPLIMAGAGAMFGTSGETYREMKLFYSEQTEEEREKLQETLAHLGFPVIIEPVVKKDEIKTPQDELQ